MLEFKTIRAIMRGVVRIKLDEMRARHSLTPKPYDLAINELIREYNSVKDVPDIKAKSLFASLPPPDTEVSYQELKYQLMIGILGDILDKTDSSSTTYNQASQIANTLGLLASALQTQEIKKSSARSKFGITAFLCFFIAGIAGYISGKEPEDKKVGQQIFGLTSAGMGVAAFFLLFILYRKIHDVSETIRPRIAELNNLPLDEIVSNGIASKYNVCFGNIFTSAQLDIIRIINDLNEQGQSLPCKIASACAEDESEETILTATPNDSREQKKVNIDSTLEAGQLPARAESKKALLTVTPARDLEEKKPKEKDKQRYLVKTEGQNCFGGPYCGHCIGNYIVEKQKDTEIIPDPCSRNPIIFVDEKPILFPLGPHNLDEWRTMVKKFPVILKPLETQSLTVDKDTPSSHTMIFMPGSTKMRFTYTYLIANVNLDILGVINQIYENPDLRCKMPRHGTKTESKQSAPVLGQEAITIAEEKPEAEITIPEDKKAGLTPTAEEEEELHMVLTKGSCDYAGPYCACCISAEIASQLQQGIISPRDPFSGDPIILSRNRPTLFPLKDIFNLWENKMIPSFPNLLKPIAKPKNSLSEVQIDIKEKKDEPVISEIENPSKSEIKTTSRIPKESALLKKFAINWKEIPEAQRPLLIDEEIELTDEKGLGLD